MDNSVSASIVTGGGRGIGRAIAARLSRDTAVMVVGRTESDLVSIREEIRDSGGQCEFCVGDICDPETARHTLAAARNSGWRIRNLVCNAGIGKSGPLAMFPKETWMNIFDVNVHGGFHFIQACLPLMVEQKQGVICLINSTAGVKGCAYDSAYTASKHAMIGLAKSLALEYGKHGIVTVPLCPGFVESDMTRRTIRGLMARHSITEEEAEARVAHVNPQRRIIPPEEVAEMVAFVCSGKVPSLSGNPLILSGGE